MEVKKRGRPPKPKPEKAETNSKKRGHLPKERPDMPQKHIHASTTKLSSSGGMDQAIDVVLGKRGRSKHRQEVVHEDNTQKKRGRLYNEQSANGDVEMTCSPDKADIAMESPLSDLPSSIEFDVEPPGPTESLLSLLETERISLRQALDIKTQHQLSLARDLHPMPPEGDFRLAITSDSGLSSAFPSQCRELTEVEMVSTHDPNRRTSREGPQIDPYSVSPKFYGFTLPLTIAGTDISRITDNTTP